MDSLELIQWSAAITGLLFWAAFGAICGSFINVLVYRLPRGLNVVTPASACPACGTRLTWRENIPVLGWLILRGRCRFCRSPVSPEYPLVEALMAVLFGGMWAVWFMHPSVAPLIGIEPRVWRPDFAVEGIGRMWPMFLVTLALAGSLVASTLIDARTFTIPLVLPWFAAAVGLCVHPLHALWIERTGGTALMPHAWTIPFRPGGGVGLAIGGGLGVGISALLLWRGWLPQSFADYPEWEAKALAAEAAAKAGEAQEPSPSRAPTTARHLLTRTLLLTGPAVALMFGGFTVGLRYGNPLAWSTLGTGTGLLIGLMLRRLAPDAAGGSPADQEPIWAGYPHVRREIAKEGLFLVPAVVLGAVGWSLTRPAGALGTLTSEAPLWLHALAGSLLGALAGGGIVWIFRIGGSLVLGKEAMGLGDVHLMAGVGACLGWIDALLAFFVAPFLGIGWAVLGLVFRQVFHRQGTALPYGPHLAGATLLILLGKPMFEMLLSGIMGRPINLP